jgi:phosphate uptake regulator
MVDYRKIQQTGGKSGSSFLIILPKDWVVRQKLTKGDPVVVAEREDGCLIVDPRLPKAGETRSTSVDIQSNLRWSLTAAYLLGFDEIQVVSNKQITSDQRAVLKKIIKQFVALEVTDESDNQIVIRCLVDPSTLPVQKAMRRMNLITTRMLDDSVSAYYEGNKENAADIIERDEEVNRLFFLTVRQLRSTIQYPRMSEKMNITPVEALDFRLAVQYIERIADLAVDIARQTNEPLSSKLIKRIDPIVAQIKAMLEKSVSNLFKFDSKKVDWVIDAEQDLISETSKLRQFLVSLRGEDTQAHLYVTDRLLRIGEAAKDITDLALPHT